MNTPLVGAVLAIEDRGISLEAAKAYGITVAGDKQIYPYYDVNGQHVANKVRHVKTKDFHAEGRLHRQGCLDRTSFVMAASISQSPKVSWTQCLPIR